MARMRRMKAAPYAPSRAASLASPQAGRGLSNAKHIRALAETAETKRARLRQYYDRISLKRDRCRKARLLRTASSNDDQRDASSQISRNADWPPPRHPALSTRPRRLSGSSLPVLDLISLIAACALRRGPEGDACANLAPVRWRTVVGLGAGERHPQGYRSAPLLSKRLRAPPPVFLSGWD
jgi:hypothetical protein